ncbi:MAG: glycosyltransferase [Syntrophaceae bacterium]|nr:glycosyltransferase [Deltaproteobacteria bacterium]
MKNMSRGKDCRLAIFLPSLRGGGAERVMMNLANGFTGKGLSVDLVLVKAEGAYLKGVPDNVRVVDLDAGRVARSLPALVRYLRSERPGALLSAMNHANIIALWARSLAGTPTQVTISEHNNLSASMRNVPSRRARFMPWLMRCFYPLADSIVAVSKGVADDLASAIHMPRERITVIYNPVVTPELLQMAREPLDHPWFRPGEPPVILGAGRLTRQKDFSMLIRSFALVRKERPARLLILGEGGERRELEELAGTLGIAGDIDMPGFVDNPYKYMAGAALFALSSKWEGLSTVVIEAMACGTPVVSTDCPSGPREILMDGQYGSLVPVGNVEYFTRAVLKALEHPFKPSFAWLDRFCPEYVMQKYLEVLGVRQQDEDRS